MVAICGNKADLAESLAPAAAAALEAAMTEVQSVRCSARATRQQIQSLLELRERVAEIVWARTSALTGEGVVPVFEELARRVVAQRSRDAQERGLDLAAPEPARGGCGCG